LLEEVPQLAINLFTIVTQYLHYSRERYRMLATASVDRRVHWAVTELARNFGYTPGHATTITGRAFDKISRPSDYDDLHRKSGAQRV
jgi:hypothetical protein